MPQAASSWDKFVKILYAIWAYVFLVVGVIHAVILVIAPSLFQVVGFPLALIVLLVGWYRRSGPHLKTINPPLSLYAMMGLLVMIGGLSTAGYIAADVRPYRADEQIGPYLISFGVVFGGSLFLAISDALHALDRANTVEKAAAWRAGQMESESAEGRVQLQPEGRLLP